MAITLVECYSVSPSHGATAEQSFPLLYLDVMWFPIRPTETLHFYTLRSSERCFIETIVVELRHSLSITLKHFLPLASKIIFPLTSASMPISRYATGDSVSLTIATSDADFTSLTANNSKNADEFHSLVPQLPPAVYSSNDIQFSAFAVQVTLFPDQGICIGFTHHHAICDATSLFGFVQTWGSIHKSNGDDRHLDRRYLPFYGRDHVQDANRLSTLVWNQVKTTRPIVSLSLSLPLHKLRATFVVSEAEIEQLKKSAMINNPDVGRVSTFVAVCAHLWSCLAKASAAAGEAVEDDEAEYLTSLIDCRPRLNPPLPSNYFGNCLTMFRVVSTHGRLKGDEGFVAAVEAIAGAIYKTVGNKQMVADFCENRQKLRAGLLGKRVLGVAGSSRLDQCGADYGWGRGVKYECIHTDFSGGVNLCKGRDGGVEIGLSLLDAKMDIFASLFKKYVCINSNL